MDDLDKLFNKLRQTPIDDLDLIMLERYFVPNISLDGLYASDYEIIIEDKVEGDVLRFFLSLHYWDWEDYLTQTKIGWKIL